MSTENPNLNRVTLTLCNLCLDSSLLSIGVGGCTRACTTLGCAFSAISPDACLRDNQTIEIKPLRMVASFVRVKPEAER